MAFEQSGLSALRPEEVADHNLPTAIRGYDKNRVDRHLARVADAYALTVQRCIAQRNRLQLLEAELDAAEGEARASARSVAELMRGSPTPQAKPPQTQGTRDDLEARLERSERGREQALADLREESDRASALGERLKALEAAERTRPQTQIEAPQPAVPDEEAARLLVAATRDAEIVRTAARARALRTLMKARERAALVRAQTESERAALAELEEHRGRLEREAGEILAQARSAAERGADEILVQARAEAGEILAQARSEAGREADEIIGRRPAPRRDEIMAQARSEAGREADEIRAQARSAADLEANDILAHARSEADRVLGAIEAQRERTRELLKDALASLSLESAPPSEGLMADLEHRLHETTEPAAT